MGFVKKWTAQPHELTPDPVTGNLPTGKPTPKIAAQGVGVVVLTAVAPIVTSLLAKRNIRMSSEELMGLVTAMVAGVGAVVTAVGYLKKNKAPARMPSDPGAS